jgi:regulatory factor X
MDISDKTPTSNSLMSSAQQAAAAAAAQQRPGFAGHASIRRQGGGVPDGATIPMRPSPPGSAQTETYLASPQRTSIRMLPNFPTVDEAIGPSSTSIQAQIAREVWGWFENHLDSLLDCVKALKFDQFEGNLKNFWQGLKGDHREVVHAPAMAGLMSRADAMVYDVSCNHTVVDL